MVLSEYILIKCRYFSISTKEETHDTRFSKMLTESDEILAEALLENNTSDFKRIDDAQIRMNKKDSRPNFAKCVELCTNTKFRIWWMKGIITYKNNVAK